MKLAVFLIVMASVLFLSACPFSSDLPLGSPTEAALDRALTGTWQAQDPESKEWVSFTFVPFDENGYVVSSEGKRWRVFVTMIDDEHFLSIKELDGAGDGGWIYANYRVSGDTLTIRLVDDALFSSETFPSSESLRDFVRKNLHDPRLYASGADSVMSWRRAAS